MSFDSTNNVCFSATLETPPTLSFSCSSCSSSFSLPVFHHPLHLHAPVYLFLLGAPLPNSSHFAIPLISPFPTCSSSFSFSFKPHILHIYYLYPLVLFFFYFFVPIFILLPLVIFPHLFTYPYIFFHLIFFLLSFRHSSSHSFVSAFLITHDGGKKKKIQTEMSVKIFKNS